MIIIGGASLSEQCTADLCHGIQAIDNSRICHRLLFHEHGIKAILCAAISSVNEATKALTKLQTKVMS